jgi:hypothetical protein
LISDKRGFEYYTYDALNKVFEKKVLNNYAIDDCLDNYTDFVSENLIKPDESSFKWYNHDLHQDILYYGNNVDNKWPFNPSFTNNNIQKTYCCLPPDFLYCCRNTVEINNIFTNSNIIGVIPRNLTKTIKNTVISNIFTNVNIMPNIEYYYDIKGGLNDQILNEIESVDSDSDNDYTVVFRDKYGILKQRKPVKSDRNLGQFVYVPANFTTSNSLTNLFNFRYNLPKHWVFTKAANDNNFGSFKTTRELDDAISRGIIDVSKFPYHSQYYILTDDCVNWDNVSDAKSVFITNNQDVDFGNTKTLGHERSYYDGNKLVDIDGKNTWTDSQNVSLNQTWSQKIIENIYIDLGLCGKKNDYNMIEDYGCPINILNDRTIHLDNFISGYITLFLNGRVFYDLFEVNQLQSSYHGNASSCVIDYVGRGKNIILPKFNSSPKDGDFVFIPIDKEYVYYDFMIDGDESSRESSLKNYYTYFAKDILGENRSLFETRYNKYTFK